MNDDQQYQKLLEAGRDINIVRENLQAILRIAKEHPLFDHDMFEQENYDAMENCDNSDTVAFVDIAINAKSALGVIEKYIRLEVNRDKYTDAAFAVRHDGDRLSVCCWCQRYFDDYSEGHHDESTELSFCDPTCEMQYSMKVGLPKNYVLVS